jgi:26S proteasome regulatory subunit N1
MLSATASIGCVLLWDVGGGINVMDKYLYSSEDYVKAGALLGTGILTSFVGDEVNPVKALLEDYVSGENKPSEIMRQMAVVGMGIGYAGKPVDDLELAELLSPLRSSDTPIELASYAALSLGLIYLGTSNPDISTAMITALLERPVADLKHPACKFLCTG